MLYILGRVPHIVEIFLVERKAVPAGRGVKSPFLMFQVYFMDHELQFR